MVRIVLLRPLMIFASAKNLFTFVSSSILVIRPFMVAG